MWRCDHCTDNCLSVNKSELATFIGGKVQDALKELTATFETLKADFLKAAEAKLASSTVPNLAAGTNPTTTYSQAVKNKNLPAVIIKPKNPTQTTEKTKEDLMRDINPVDADLQLAKVKSIRNGAMVISCRDKQDTEKLMELAEKNLSGTYEVRKIRGISPRVRVAGINREYTEEELLRILRLNNNAVIRNESEVSIVQLSATKKNSRVYQAVLQLDRATYDRVVKAGNLFINYDSCRVFDALGVLRCYNCNDFHHSSKHCNNQCSCPRCGGGHAVKDCQSEILKCPNCTKINNGNVATDHAAWDADKCAAYNSALEKLRKEVLYDIPTNL